MMRYIYDFSIKKIIPSKEKGSGGIFATFKDTLSLNQTTLLVIPF